MESFFRVKMADEVIEIYPLTASCVRFCKAYLTEETEDFSLVLTPGDIEHERRLATMEASESYLETLALCRKCAAGLIDFDTLLLHGSCIAVDGEGYLFTAPSGVGKSTHSRLWAEMLGARAVMINDDKPFLKITDAGVTAYGSPWNGEHHLGANCSVPVKAICLLQRDETNHIAAIAPDEAFPILLGQTYRPEGKRFMEKLLPLVDRLTRQVRLYTLGCNMQPEAARVSFAEMSK